jgi:hypothetical protein
MSLELFEVKNLALEPQQATARTATDNYHYHRGTKEYLRNRLS